MRHGTTEPGEARGVAASIQHGARSRHLCPRPLWLTGCLLLALLLGLPRATEAQVPARRSAAQLAVRRPTTSLALQGEEKTTDALSSAVAESRERAKKALKNVASLASALTNDSRGMQGKAAAPRKSIGGLGRAAGRGVRNPRSSSTGALTQMSRGLSSRSLTKADEEQLEKRKQVIADRLAALSAQADEANDASQSAGRALSALKAHTQSLEGRARSAGRLDASLSQLVKRSRLRVRVAALQAKQARSASDAAQRSLVKARKQALQAGVVMPNEGQADKAKTKAKPRRSVLRPSSVFTSGSRKPR